MQRTGTHSELRSQIISRSFSTAVGDQVGIVGVVLLFGFFLCCCFFFLAKVKFFFGNNILVFFFVGGRKGSPQLKHVHGGIRDRARVAWLGPE